MTTNDPGHVNNLDRSQREALKTFWPSLLSAIDADPLKVLETNLGDELFFLIGQENPDSVLLRWLRARKWNVSAAVQHMMDTLKWRQEWGVRTLLEKGESALDPDECASGKMYVMGRDKAGRCITYVHASEHVKGQYLLESTEKLIILYMETSRYISAAPNEDGTVVIDLGNVTYQNLDYQHIKFLINAMQNCYPECLALGIVVNAPWTFNVVWNVIRPWLDPVVAAKIHFLKNQTDLTEHIDPSSIPIRLGGTHIDFKYRAPTKEDKALIETIRQDAAGMGQAKLKHKEAAKIFIDTTIKWAKASEHNDTNEKSNRMAAAQGLANAFKEFLPYVSTRTHYHRTGDINEPMFDIVYKRIRDNETETTYF